jgi:NAD+-dependent protein deacetylase sirtuin 4
MFSCCRRNVFIPIIKVAKYSVDNKSGIVYKFVPKHQRVTDDEINVLNDLVDKTKKLFVVSGAGISTESGIPDYRSEGVGLYATSNHKPMEYNDFLSSSKRRKVYWARNYVSWPRFSSFLPNLNHKIMCEWEKKRKIHHHATQNVDSLLIKAGCQRITELHGTSNRVKCIDCKFTMSRDTMQSLIASYNKDWKPTSNLDIRPDNDALLTEEEINAFILPTCPKCKEDRLKPEIVFFGDNIEKSTVDSLKLKLNECDALLAIGTSLQVMNYFYCFLSKLTTNDLNFNKKGLLSISYDTSSKRFENTNSNCINW